MISSPDRCKRHIKWPVVFSWPKPDPSCRHMLVGECQTPQSFRRIPAARHPRTHPPMLLLTIKMTGCSIHSPSPSPNHRLGLNGRLNPPTRFMYCRYSVFFSRRTPLTLLPLTFVFFVDLKPAKPICARSAAVSGSASSSMSISVVGGPG